MSDCTFMLCFGDDDLLDHALHISEPQRAHRAWDQEQVCSAPDCGDGIPSQSEETTLQTGAHWIHRCSPTLSLRTCMIRKHTADVVMGFRTIVHPSYKGRCLSARLPQPLVTCWICVHHHVAQISNHAHFKHYRPGRNGQEHSGANVP